MSKGLSRQQLRILGLAVAVSRLRHDGIPKTYVAERDKRWRCPIAQDHDSPNVWEPQGAHRRFRTAVISHIVGGIGLRPKVTLGHPDPGLGWVYLETTPEALSARSSISRAISSLLRRELLAYAIRQQGYVLTAAGLEIGLKHELTIPDLDRRLWLIRSAAKEKHEDWRLNGELLPSPALPE